MLSERKPLTARSSRVVETATRTPGHGTDEIPVALEAVATDLSNSPPAIPSKAREDRAAIYRTSLKIADAIAAAGAVSIAVVALGKSYSLMGALLLIPLIVLLSKATGIYSRQDLLVRKSTLDEAPALFQLATLYVLIVWLIEGFFVSTERRPTRLLALWIATFVLLLLARAVARSVSKFLSPPERCLIIGDAEACELMQLKVARHPALHAVVVASITSAEMTSRGSSGPAALSIDELRGIARHHRVERIIVTPTMADDAGVAEIVQTAAALGITVSVLPRVLELVGSSAQFDDVEGMPFLSTRPRRLTRSARSLKRAVDVVGATLGMVLVAPFFAIAALAIKLDSPGPLFFRQDRIGREGKRFKMLKLRTMVFDAEDQKRGLHELNEAIGLFKITNDPRVTRVGRFLRRMSLDELPQMINVLRGEMSLVGPRPLIPEEDGRIEGWHRRRLHLTPGMTGHWQILGSARIPLAEMVQIDYLYVANWSLWLDLKILLRTVPYVLARRGL